MIYFIKRNPNGAPVYDRMHTILEKRLHSHGYAAVSLLQDAGVPTKDAHELVADALMEMAKVHYEFVGHTDEQVQEELSALIKLGRTH